MKQHTSQAIPVDQISLNQQNQISRRYLKHISIILLAGNNPEQEIGIRQHRVTAVTVNENAQAMLDIMGCFVHNHRLSGQGRRPCTDSQVQGQHGEAGVAGDQVQSSPRLDQLHKPIKIHPY